MNDDKTQLKCPLFEMDVLDYLEWLSYFTEKIEKYSRGFRFHCGNAIVQTDKDYYPRTVYYRKEKLKFHLDTKRGIVKITKIKKELK